MELWGGIECTINRLGDRYFNQVKRTGHDAREDDLTRCVELGIKTLRYPVLWESVAPDSLDEPDWSWTDKRLACLREGGVNTVAGLVHHGSGPRYTSLVDPGFDKKLARYARMVAERYPWIDRYTPVNEPLTTARFSGLYGHWYPHSSNPRAFKDALINQCRGVALAMHEIRRINPSAQLVQTEDLGKTYSTPTLAYQARFNNELRWLVWDLLGGKVTRHHRLWRWLTKGCNAKPGELLWFVDNPCPPDIIGVNHYITSERFLDERLERYPERFHGGNHRHRYADVEAARSLATPTGGLAPLLCEAWSRYRLPIAITEVHIDATRDDQLRWVAETWDAALAARRGGADVRAVTAWALFGLYDWNCLLTECRNYYEPGAFDIRGPRPRETAVGGFWRDLGRGNRPSHPVLATPGWWHREGRFYGPPAEAGGRTAPRPMWGTPVPDRPILISGATGTLGQAFARVCKRRGLSCHLLDRAELDIADPDSVRRAIETLRPWAVVNAAGYVRVDLAETDAEKCYRENTLGPEVLAGACQRAKVPLVVFSSDLVFDGLQREPYVESSDPRPLNVYGRSKAEAEARVLRRHPEALIIRTSSFFGPWDEHNFIALLLRHMRAKEPFLAANDLTVSPTYVPDLVNACLDLLIDRESGIWHLTNGEALTWEAFGSRAVRQAGLQPSLLRPCSTKSLNFSAPRPAYSAMRSERSLLMPGLDEAIDRYFRECEALAA